MNSATRHDHGDPNDWLRELSRVHRAAWEPGHSIRAALTIGLPWAVGFAVDAVMPAMWISFGALMASSSEPAGDYRLRLRLVFVATTIGALGFFAGYLSVLPLPLLVLTMAVLGGLGGLLSSRGSVLSIGTMQALLTASIAIGVPKIAPFWQPALFYLAGIAIYAALLAIETLIRGHRSREMITTGLSEALAGLATSRARLLSGEVGSESAEAARRLATDRFTELGGAMIRASQGGAFGGMLGGARSGHVEADHLASVLAHADAAFVAILAERDPASLMAAAGRLRSISTPRGPEATLVPDSLAATIDAFAGCLADRGRTEGRPEVVRQSLFAARTGWRPDRTAMQIAAKTAICMGLAYAARFIDGSDHWFWIPLTVSLVLKPDLGSVFARAVLRVAGTILGAAIGAAILAILPKSAWVAVPMILLAAIVPTAMRRSYLLQSAALTPLVLIIVGAITPGPVDLDYGLQRIFDTAIGGAIVLIFGYFIWPRRHFGLIDDNFRAAKKSITAYLLAPNSREERRSAYQALSRIRGRLGSALVEPPPASEEAAAWIPLIAAGERICDHITAYASQTTTVSPAEAASLNALADYLVAAPADRSKMSQPEAPADDPPLSALFDAVIAELRHMDRLRDGHFLKDPAGH